MSNYQGVRNSEDSELLAKLSRRILCWVCSEENVDSAVPLAQTLARMHRGECHVVMSLDTPHGPNATAGRFIPLTPEIINKAKRKLAALYGDDVYTLVLPGHPIAEIQRYARNKQMSLIVVGEQGLAVEQEYGQYLRDDAPCTVMTLFQLLPNIEKENPDPVLQGLVRRSRFER